jgi:hypothetical protein
MNSSPLMELQKTKSSTSLLQLYVGGVELSLYDLILLRILIVINLQFSFDNVVKIDTFVPWLCIK